MKWSKFKALWAAAILLIIIACVFIFRSFNVYGPDDQKALVINLRAGTFGIAISAALSLIIVVISLQMESNLRQGALTSARFLFLRTDVESFKEALIRYIDTFRLGNGATSQLAQSSWESFDKQFWPQKNTIKQLETAIDQHNLSGMYRIGSAKSSVDNLWNSLQKIVTASGSNIFEGREHLVKRAVFTALYEVGLLRADILHLIQSNNEDDEIDLTSVNQRIRLCAITCTKVLEDMADLASSVKTK